MDKTFLVNGRKSRTASARSRGRRVVIVASIFACCRLAATAASDQVTVREQAGASTTNYPVQIGRPFVTGEILNCPQALVNGTPVTTQANVTQRHTDGTVKHAIIAFLIPNLPANSSVAVTFQNQASCNTTPLTLSQMTSASYNFNAQISMTNGPTITADALTMLNAGAYTTWTPGQVAHTILIADDGQEGTCSGIACSNYDLGFDAYKVIRPRFYVTFWPTINKVTVRYVAEISNTQGVEDQTYSLVLSLGNSSPISPYTLASFRHPALTRWTKTFWIGGAPSIVAIDHNLAYLESTNAIPTYDVTYGGTRLAPLEAGNWTAWNAVPHDPFSQNSTCGGSAEIANFPSVNFSPPCGGLWTISMLSPGDRPDLGIYTGWVTNWLFTMNDYRNYQIALGQADLAAAWPVHLREGKSGNNLTQGVTSPTPACTFQCNANGLGKIVSIAGRPNFRTDQGVLGGQTQVGTVSSNSWIPEAAHMPDGWTVPYLLTGDFFYLEESFFFGGFQAAAANPNGANYGRAANVVPGSTGNIAAAANLEERGVAWQFRSVANTWAIAPDNTPEKSYFETVLNQFLASAEGMHGVTGTAYQGTDAWNFGYTTQRVWTNETGATIYTDGATNKLHEWYFGGFGGAVIAATGIGNNPSNGQVFKPIDSIGTVSTSGVSNTVTFSNPSDCAVLGVGSNLVLTSGANAGANGIITALNCPTATIYNSVNWSPGAFIWANVAGSAGGPWMDSYLMASLGRTAEVFGSAGAPIKSWYAKLITDTLTDSNYNPWLIAEYRSPQISGNLHPNNWFPDLPAKKSAFVASEQTRTTWASTNYAAIAMAGVSYVAGEINGPAAWNFMNTNERLTDSVFATDTRFAIVPGTAATIPNYNPCDLNSDGTVDLKDVQIAINQAIGKAPCSATLASGSTCTIVQVQRVVTAALSHVCRVGQ